MNQQLAAGEAGMTRTEGGLIVPTTAVGRRQRTIGSDVVKKIRRAINELKPEGLAFLPVCTDCGGLVVISREGKIVETVEDVDGTKKDAPGGEVVFKCKCSDRRVVARR